jgi:pSer/pThr/pTyr-binding forkhead associated (FHA) protein
VHIGRGYDNDVIVDDPYVAARHLRIVRDENGALVAEDLGSANGLVADQDRRRVERAVLDGRRSIEIGRTRLRVREVDHAVEPERISRPRVRIWPLVLGLAGALFGAEFLTMWLGQTTEQKPGDYLSSLLMLGLFVVVWTTAWAVMSRIFSGRA